jgi:hypothetical protein
MITGLLWFVLALIATAAYVGARDYITIDFVLEIKKWNNPYYNIGVSFDEYPTEDGQFMEQELKIGLFVINIVIIFYKNSA